MAVAFESVKKTQGVFDQKKGRRWQRKSPTSKNEHYRRMLSACVKNRIGFFRYVLNDIWYASSEEHASRKGGVKERVRHANQDRPQGVPLPGGQQGGRIRARRLLSGTGTEHNEAGFYPEQVPFALLCCASRSSRTRTVARVSCIWLVQLHDRFWAMGCSAACESPEWNGEAFRRCS